MSFGSSLIIDTLIIGEGRGLKDQILQINSNLNPISNIFIRLLLGL
jgi:hypothetical protein